MAALLLGVAAWPNPVDPAAPGGWTDLSPDEFAALLDWEEVVLLNVHLPYEGELPGTDLFIAYDEVNKRRGDLPAERDAALAVYCRTGRMSATAVRTLAGLGYTRIYQLAGGFEAWQAAGYELVHAPARRR